MKYCQHCGEDITDGMIICPKCDRPIAPIESTSNLKTSNSIYTENENPIIITALKAIAWIEMVGSVFAFFFLLKERVLFIIALAPLIYGIVFGVLMLVVALIAEKVIDIEKKIQ